MKTFAAPLSIILQQRHRASGLLLSEVGAFLAGPEHAPAGTKRLINLLRSRRWHFLLLSDFLWERANARIRDLVCRGQQALLLWDESVLEKPESIALEGLGSVRSTKAQRLKRIRKGYYTPPGGPPVFVPGMHWLSLLLVEQSGPPMLATPVRHWAFPGALWLVISSRGKGHQPGYLLTNELAERPAQMWSVVFAYARRWQIEMSFRFSKRELAMESPRLWWRCAKRTGPLWDNRLKLQLMVSLAYAFLLSLLDPEVKGLRDALLKRFCPRTGKRSREVSTPLYRLRAAICFLFLSLRTLPQPQSSG